MKVTRKTSLTIQMMMMRVMTVMMLIQILMTEALFKAMKKKNPRRRKETRLKLLHRPKLDTWMRLDWQLELQLQLHGNASEI
jgi:hypothetical protein